MDSDYRDKTLTPYLTPLGAWALALGTSIGWGSLVVTTNSYLLQAGPVGSIAGLLLGAIIMVVISRNYHYLINRYPSAGGAYTFTREVFGYDHGFLAAWFMSLTYIAMFWANATSLPLFARYFLGNVFQFGFSYSVFGYEVYFGEMLLSIAAILLIALLCAKRRKATARLVIVLAFLLSICIIICFVAAMTGHTGSVRLLDPAFIPDKGELTQIAKILCISPWAFIGFESISHSSEEFSFPHRKVFGIMVAAVVTATVLYICVMLLSVSAYPAQYDSWLAYISDLGNLQGIEALPPFYAASRYLGSAGVALLVITLFALIITSLVGNIIALSRLLCEMSRDAIIPTRFSELNKHHIPARTILIIIVPSVLIPLLGRTAIGWIVDVTTIGAIIIYGFVSASALKLANISNDRPEQLTGGFGLVVMVALGAYLLLPSLIGAAPLEGESYFLFIAWGILGSIFFRSTMRRDKQKRFGKSIVVWIALLSLILFIAFIWMNQTMIGATDDLVNNVRDYYMAAGTTAQQTVDTSFIEEQVAALRASNLRTMLIASIMLTLAVVILLTNFAYMYRRARESEEQLSFARDMAYTDPLTGVKSKNAYVEHEHALNTRIAEGSAGPFAVVVCDVNGLKQVNDTLGHKAGDEYIHSASMLICELFSHSPVFRIGGDEFVVLLSGQDYETRETTMEDLHAQSVHNRGRGKVVVAGGISDFIPGQDAKVHDVFERADALMYEEKRALKAGAQ